jgi:hypothetical protein
MKATYLLTLILSCYCYAHGHTICNLKGEWIIKTGRLFENYEIARSYSYNRVSFSSDSVELASGFFYNILPLDATESRIGKFPFVYYGNKEHYKIQGDSLSVYSSPYREWKKFRISCAGRSSVTLTGLNGSLLLVKDKTPSVNYECIIRYIAVEVNEGPMSTYIVHYKSTYTLSDSLIFQQKDSISKSFNETRLRLKSGTFQTMCVGVGKHLDLLGVVKLFPTKEYDFGRVYIEIGLKDGRIIKAEIQNQECPEDLWFALIPALYGHQRILYSEPPVPF